MAVGKIGFFRDLKRRFYAVGLLLAGLFLVLPLVVWRDIRVLAAGVPLLLVCGAWGVWWMDRTARRRWRWLNHLFLCCRISDHLAWCQTLDQELKRPEQLRVPPLPWVRRAMLHRIVTIKLRLTDSYLALDSQKKTARSLREAEEALMGLPQHAQAPYRPTLWNARFLLALQVGNMTRAEQLLQEERTQPGEGLRVMAALHHALLQLERGAPKESLTLLPARLAQARSCYHRVQLSWYLAQAYRFNQRPEQARAFLEVVVRQGGDSCYVQWAEETIPYLDGSLPP